MKLDVFFDYTCPFCYVGHAYVKNLLPVYPHIEAVWWPCEAHPRPEPRMSITPPAPSWWRFLEAPASAAGLGLNLPHSPVAHSDLAARGMYIVAAAGGDVWVYHDRVYAAVFVDAQNIEEPDVLADCADGLGIAQADFLAALDRGDGDWEQRRANTYAYVESGVWAVPSFLLGDNRLDAAEGVGITERQLKALLDSCPKE